MSIIFYFLLGALLISSITLSGFLIVVSLVCRILEENEKDEGVVTNE